MARKLKTYTTSAGFFDLASAAPSMKAALESFSTDGNKVTLTFNPEGPVELEDVGGGHLTACVLHTSRRHRI